MSETREAGRWIECGACDNGTIAVYSASDFEGPGECRYCNSGRIWRYPSGRLALYPGGPFVGREPLVASPTPSDGQ